jgi:hypothetical protein
LNGDVPRPTLESPLLLEDGSFQFTLVGVTGQSYTIWASTNLVVWTVLTNVVSATPAVNLVDAEAAALNRRYYRASVPSPEVASQPVRLTIQSGPLLLRSSVVRP